MKNIQVSDEGHKELKIFAAKQGVTLSAAIRLALTFADKHLEKFDEPKSFFSAPDSRPARLLGDEAPAAEAAQG